MPSLLNLLGLPLSIALSFRKGFQPPLFSKVPIYNPLMGQSTLPSTFSVLCWNIQYCASRKYHFFYDGGRDVHASIDVVQKTLTELSDFLRELDPDIIALQEVDRNSKRSAYIDQILHIRDALPLYAKTEATYFQVPFVPIPPYNPLSKVDCSLLTLSRSLMKHAARHQLPLLNESPIRQSFNLKRAILESRHPIANTQLHVANTHLSAFSFGDGTLKKQVDCILKWISERPKNVPWIVMGDFNMLPVGDDPHRLLTPKSYALDKENPIVPLTQKYQHVFPKEAHTYLPFGHETPDRKIDYIFFSEHLSIEEARVCTKVHLSDHLPLYVGFSLR